MVGLPWLACHGLPIYTYIFMCIYIHIYIYIFMDLDDVLEIAHMGGEKGYDRLSSFKQHVFGSARARTG